MKITRINQLKKNRVYVSRAHFGEFWRRCQFIKRTTSGIRDDKPLYHFRTYRGADYPIGDWKWVRSLNLETAPQSNFPFAPKF